MTVLGIKPVLRLPVEEMHFLGRAHEHLRVRTEVASERHAELLTHENPARLLRDEPTIPVEPVERRRGVGDRLRELARSLAGGRKPR